MNANVANSTCASSIGAFAHAHAIAWCGSLGASLAFANMRSAEAQIHLHIGMIGMQEQMEHHAIPAEPAGQEISAT